MEIHGKLNLVDSEVRSDKFTSDKQFNNIIVNNISEVNQLSLDHDVIIFNKENNQYYTYNSISDSWKSFDELENNTLLKNDSRPIFSIPVTEVYNKFNFDSISSNYLTVDSELFNFGEIGSPIDFVIDFWFDMMTNIGAIFYNGLNTGQVDLEVNKNFLLTTSGSTLVKDPNYQADPTVVTNTANDGYLQLMRPYLKSSSKVTKQYLTHVAIIRSGSTTYLAIDGKIEASAPSVEYFHYNDVKIGTGYGPTKNNLKLTNLRISKGTDLGWTSDFVPPAYNPTPDANTDFLMIGPTLTDETSNYSINIIGTEPTVSQDEFFYQLSNDQSHLNCILDGGGIETNIKFPRLCSPGSIFEIRNTSKLITFAFHPINTQIGYESKKAHQSYNDINLNYKFSFINNQWVERNSNINIASFPLVDVSTKSYNHTYSYCVFPNSKLYNVNSNLHYPQFDQYIETDANSPYKPFTKSYINCNLLPTSGIELPVLSSNSSKCAYRFVLRLDSNISSNTFFTNSADAGLYLYFNNNILYCNYLVGFNYLSFACTDYLITGCWYYIYIRTDRSYISGPDPLYSSRTSYNLTHKNNETFVNNTHSYTNYVETYPTLQTLRKCPISLMYFSNIPSSFVDNPIKPTFQSLFNEV